MDLTSLFFAGLLALGVFSFDAWQHGGEINLEINMPKGYGASETSMSDTVAENIFLNEVADIDSVPTFILKPRVRSTNNPTVVSMIGDMLGLKKLTNLVQNASGIQPLIISGSITKSKDRYQLILVSNVEASKEQRLNLTVETVQGESVAQMIQRAAPQAMLNYEDYLVCLFLLHQLDRGQLAIYEPFLDRPGAEGIDLLIQSRLSEQPNGLAALGTTDEQSLHYAMFTNLQGMIALHQKDDKKARSLFESVIERRPDFAVGYLNLAFIAIHQDKYQDAIDILQKALDQGLLQHDPALLGPAYTTIGVADWGLKKYDEAAVQFATANATNPHATMANFYWGNMLAERGDKTGADDKHKIAKDNEKYFAPYAETAIYYFLLTPPTRQPWKREPRRRSR